MNGFSNLNELYKRLTPALKSKCKELERIGVNYVQPADIWNYLKNNLWIKANNLTLADMVNDIMNVNNIELETYVQKLVAKESRDVSI